jgi:uncharacterized membrane protein YbhN (UPF0104 family)
MRRTRRRVSVRAMSAAGATAGTTPRSSRIKTIAIWVVVLVVIASLADLLGWDIRGWLSDVWDTMTGISTASLVGAILVKTLQTTATAFAWYSILRYAYPGEVRWLHVLAAYAASVALNGVLPANLGTLILLIMLTQVIASASFAGILGAYGVEKIFFCVIGAFPYVYLFATVGGSFDIKFDFVHAHTVAFVIMLAGGLWLLYLCIRRIWPRIVAWWQQAKEGGAILGRPRRYLLFVALPSLVAWCAGLGVTAIFLHAYDIPVSFDTLMRIMAGNSIANVTSVTPGGAGVNQAFNVASLKGVTSSANATAYSVAQQLVTTAWNIVYGIALMTWAFGWSGGKLLLTESYADAKQKAADQKAAREARNAAGAEAGPAKAEA